MKVGEGGMWCCIKTGKYDEEKRRVLGRKKNRYRIRGLSAGIGRRFG